MKSTHYSPLDISLTTSASACVYGGCVHKAYIELRHYCTQHFLDVVVRESERKTRALNELWLRACEAEQRGRHEWKCKCGFIGAYEQRERHFQSNPGYDHLPMSSRRSVIKERDYKAHLAPQAPPRRATSHRRVDGKFDRGRVI